MPTRLVVAHCLLVPLAACASAAPPRAAGPDDLRSVAEGRAKELIREVAAESGIRLATDWRVDAGGGQPLPIDLRIAETSYGIEWVGPQDRADHGDVFPEPNGDDTLQVIPGVGDDREAHVLVLDHRSYRYDPDLERVQRGSPGVREVESRLRRDIRDYVRHIRDQGALP
ncbi:MAG: hypothetical protein AAGF12_08510 [Myxococcota bacterium]